LISNQYFFKSEEKLKNLADSCVDYIESYGEDRKISWVLMPHDDREYAGDIKAFTYLSEQLTEKGLKYFLVSTPSSAQRIKGICSLFDAVISGRMFCHCCASTRETCNCFNLSK
jgi:hypothetical protein